MTAEEFLNLSPEQQEEFINSGGILSTESKEDNNTEKLTNSSNTDTKLNSVDNNLMEAQSSSSDAIPSIATDSAVPPFNPNVFHLRDPIELLMMFDSDISSGKVKLHPWQMRFMVDFSDPRHTKEFPFLAEVRAANGSGKDKYIVAACLVWLCMCNQQAWGVATNGSGNQLDTQTALHITNLCNKINACLGANVWKCNYRHYECLITRSLIDLFATDEPLKAEGYHPIEAGGKLGIIASEAKGVTDEIFGALLRCNGVTHRVNVSSPGGQKGYFYEKCMSSISRKDLKDIKDVDVEQHIEYHVTIFDCPHITDTERRIMVADMPGGENGELYKSSALAEFTEIGEMVVIPSIFIHRANKRTDNYWIQEDYNDAGVDLSDGGDEAVLKVRNGNKVIATIPFRFTDSQDTVQFLDEKFREWKLNNAQSKIFGDCGGLGKPILDQLRRMGWKNIVYRDNRAKSNRPKIYKNWGAESWFHLKTLLERDPIILDGDKATTRQLSTRVYKIIDGQIHQLKSKIEMRAAGLPSPDRADALVLCFSNYKSQFKLPDLDKELEKQTSATEEDKVVEGDFVLKSWANNTHDRGRYHVTHIDDFSEIEDLITDYNKTVNQR